MTDLNLGSDPQTQGATAPCLATVHEIPVPIALISEGGKQQGVSQHPLILTLPIDCAYTDRYPYSITLTDLPDQ